MELQTMTAGIRPLKPGLPLSTRTHHALPVNQAKSSYNRLPEIKLSQAGLFLQPRFGANFRQDYTLEVNPASLLEAFTIGALQREVMVRNAYKASRKDNSSLKITMDANGIDDSPLINQSTLADMLLFVDRPVDVFVNAYCDVAGIKTLLSATGKRFMSADAELRLGPLTAFKPDFNSESGKAYYRLFKDYLQDFRTLVFDRTWKGAPDDQASMASFMQQVVEDTRSERPINAMQALLYGTEGLVDAVLVGPDKVITREDLLQYCQQNKINTPEKLWHFVSFKDNIKQVPAIRTLKDFAPGTLPRKPVIAYTPAKDQFKREIDAEKPGYKGSMPIVYYDPMHPMKQTVRVIHPKVQQTLQEIPLYSKVTVDGLPKGLNSTLYRDMLFFHADFQPESARQFQEAIEQMDERKQTQAREIKKPVSNILVTINSPGGYVHSGRTMKHTIEHLKTPVDMLVQGMAASCGALLLSCATGNRFATPNARIMIHMASNGAAGEIKDDTYEEVVSTLDQNTLDSAYVIGKASERPVKQVYEDMRRIDVWFTPLEAMFYGDKGLIDAIVVGPDKVITREDIWNYVVKLAKGDQKKVQSYINWKIKEKLDPDVAKRGRAAKLIAEDPFNSPLFTIRQIAAQSAKSMRKIKQFERSIETNPQSVDYYHVSFGVKRDRGDSNLANLSKQTLSAGASVGYRVPTLTEMKKEALPSKT